MLNSILNYIGGSVRWLVGTAYRELMEKPKFTYNEYIYVPKNSEDFFDVRGHRFVNVMIAIFTIAAIILLFQKR